MKRDVCKATAPAGRADLRSIEVRTWSHGWQHVFDAHLLSAKFLDGSCFGFRVNGPKESTADLGCDESVNVVVVEKNIFKGGRRNAEFFDTPDIVVGDDHVRRLSGSGPAPLASLGDIV